VTLPEAPAEGECEGDVGPDRNGGFGEVG
jgi:hypothetical protein